VAPFVELALVEPGGSLPFFGGTTSRTMDFGILEEVDYELYVNGQVADLSGGPTVFGSGLSGLRWPFVVEILEYDVPVAGDYQDVIDITVSTDQ
jgi:hypothetical protein